MPGGTIGSPVGGAFQNIPGGALGLSRDDGCWCQPINQACTALRPNNLDLVTRIINTVIMSFQNSITSNLDYSVNMNFIESQAISLVK